MLSRGSDLSVLFPAFGSMRREFERALNDVGNGSARSGLCPISISHDDQRVYVHADVPGMALEDLELRFDDGKLWIRGERKCPCDGVECGHNERMFGEFERAVAVSDVIDPASVEAELHDGVLAITLSKKPEAQPHAIEIRRGEGSTPKLTGDAQAD